MLSLRAVSRTTRALPRLAARSSPLAVSLPITARAGLAATSSSRLSCLPRLTSSFSTSALRAAQQQQQQVGEADAELSAKLESELQYEDEMAAEEQVPASVKEYLASSPFEVKDVPGNQEVKMVRQFGNEKITIAFSVAEVPYEDQYPQEDEEDVYDDAEEDEPSGKKANGGRNAAAEAEGEEGAEEGDEDMPENAPPVNFTVTVEKPGRTDAVLAVECTAQDGEVMIDYVNHYGSAAEAFAASPDASHARVERYAGPGFATLDEDLQVMMENYLDERGVSQALAVFLPDYVEYKEQREYMRWLKRVKDFVDA